MSAIWRSRRPVAVAAGPVFVLRLWTWLHAQALLQGTIGGVNSVALIEDDHRRLAAGQVAGRPHQ